jgi:glycosyltransferase involved in cell wall biosynthesis
MLSLPKISIVTPSFNQGIFLEETILSVLGQGYPNLEYFIIDGGSNDSSVEIIKKYENRLTFWCSEKDNGQSQAINKGFSMATGDIFAWLNSDDILMPHSLFLMANEYNSVGTRNILFFGDCIRFKECSTGVTCFGSNVNSDSTKYDLRICDYIFQPSSFWSKEIWIDVGPLNESLFYTFDWEWFLRAKEKKYIFKPLSKVFSLYRIHDAHKSSNGGKIRQAEISEVYNRFSYPEISNLYSSIISDLDNSLKRNIFIQTKRKIIIKFNNKLDKFSFLKKIDKKYKNYPDSLLDGLCKMI